MHVPIIIYFKSIDRKMNLRIILCVVFTLATLATARSPKKATTRQGKRMTYWKKGKQRITVGSIGVTY